MQRKPLRPALAFNACMDSRPPTQQRRNALLQFEAVYGDWREATDAWLAAEVLLWTETLRGAGSMEIARLGAEAARLRDSARNAYFRVMDALMQTLPD